MITMLETRIDELKSELKNKTKALEVSTDSNLIMKRRIKNLEEWNRHLSHLLGKYSPDKPFYKEKNEKIGDKSLLHYQLIKNKE